MTTYDESNSLGPRAASVRLFGSLRAIGADLGLPASLNYDVGAQGMPARDVAAGLGLPLDRVEGVFVNHTAHGLNHAVMPGDRIAFVAPEVPGPHRYSLGLYQAGKDPDA